MLGVQRRGHSHGPPIYLAVQSPFPQGRMTWKGAQLHHVVVQPSPSPSAHTEGMMLYISGEEGCMQQAVGSAREHNPTSLSLLPIYPLLLSVSFGSHTSIFPQMCPHATASFLPCTAANKGTGTHFSIV